MKHGYKHSCKVARVQEQAKKNRYFVGDRRDEQVVASYFDLTDRQITSSSLSLLEIRASLIGLCVKCQVLQCTSYSSRASGTSSAASYVITGISDMSMIR